MSKKPHFLVRFLFFMLLTCLFLGLSGWMSASLSRLEKKVVSSHPVSKDDLSFHWHPDLFKIITFGHTPVAVDWLLIRFLGEDYLEHVQEGVQAKVYYYLDLATDLDPAFFTLYTAGTNFLAVARNDKKSAYELITKGENFRRTELERYPQSFQETEWKYAWRVPFLRGYVNLFELENLKEAARDYEAMDALPGVPPMLKKFTERFSQPGGVYAVGLRVLKGMISTSETPQIKKELEKKYEILFWSQYLFELNESFKKSKLSWRKFKRENRIPDRDPWGGEIYLDRRSGEGQGKIDSKTPRPKILGLE